MDFMGIVGIFVFLFISFLLSSDRSKIDWKLVLGGLVLQWIIAIIVLKTSFGEIFFLKANTVATTIINLSDQGASFVFGENFKEHYFAFKVLPTIIFISSLSYLLFYWGIIQKIVLLISWVMQRFMKISGVEGLVASANVFCGQTEAPMFVRPYIKSMSRSEINIMMTTGMATVAGGVLAAYVGFGIEAGHLISATLMSVPGAIVIAKIIEPETKESGVQNSAEISWVCKEVNSFEAACKGASDGLKLALNVAAMLIAFIALIALFNLILAQCTAYFGYSLSLQDILGFLFKPIAFLIGVSWQDSALIGGLLGERMVLNEFVSYMHLSEFIKSEAISPRSVKITTYALCGFANFSSIAIQIGGLGSLEPEKKKDFALCAFRAMIGGSLATFMSAATASLFIS